MNLADPDSQTADDNAENRDDQSLLSHTRMISAVTKSGRYKMLWAGGLFLALPAQNNRYAALSVGSEVSVRRNLWGGALWSLSYFAGSCGGAPISVIRRYIEQQQTPR